MVLGFVWRIRNVYQHPLDSWCPQGRLVDVSRHSHRIFLKQMPKFTIGKNMRPNELFWRVEFSSNKGVCCWLASLTGLSSQQAHKRARLARRRENSYIGKVRMLQALHKIARGSSKLSPSLLLQAIEVETSVHFWKLGGGPAGSLKIASWGPKLLKPASGRSLEAPRLVTYCHDAKQWQRDPLGSRNFYHCNSWAKNIRKKKIFPQ